MTSCTTTSSEPLNTASGGKRSGSTSTTWSRSMGMRAVLWRFDQVFGLRRSCSEEWSVWGGCGVLDWTLGLPCSPLSRLIESRRRWFTAWAARRSAITSSSTLSSRLTSSRVCASTMLCRSRSSSILPLAPVARGGVYGEPLCQISSVVATRQGMGFQPPIFEVIPSHSPFNTRVRICSSKWAPRWLHRICCFFTIRLLTTYSLFHMTLHSFLSHITPINIRDFTTRVLTPRHPPYPLASNGLLRSAHQRWRPDTSLV